MCGVIIHVVRRLANPTWPSKKANLTPVYAESTTSSQTINTLQPITQAQNYKNVLMEGYFDNNHSFLLDNKVYDHRIGYEVLTPFYVKNKRSSILVNRGWMPQGPSRKHKPFIPPVLGDRSIQGVLFWPGKTFHFPDIIEQSWPKRIQALTPSFLEKNHFTHLC